MLQLDMEIGNSSQATQAVVTGSLHRLNTMFLRYPHQIHQPRPSGCLTLSGTQKKGMTCPENTPTSSRSSFPACSSTINTQCPCTSLRRTPAVIPRALGRGGLGCRISARPENLPAASWTSDLYSRDSRFVCYPNLGSLGTSLAPKTTLRYLISTPGAFTELITSRTLLLLAGACVYRQGG